jgi:hypothetical protein
MTDWLPATLCRAGFYAPLDRELLCDEMNRSLFVMAGINEGLGCKR